MRVAILGINLPQLICGHRILDKYPNSEIYLISERAEAGLIGESPGLFSKSFSELIPINWISSMGSQTPKPDSTAVRHSWLERAIATKLVQRGANLQLRTKVSKISSSSKHILHLSGAGPLSGSELEVNQIIKYPIDKNQKKWVGGIHNDELINSNHQGYRPDGLIESWWPEEEEPQPNRKFLQSMEWFGQDPSYSLESEIELGLTLASTIG